MRGIERDSPCIDTETITLLSSGTMLCFAAVEPRWDWVVLIDRTQIHLLLPRHAPSTTTKFGLDCLRKYKLQTLTIKCAFHKPNGQKCTLIVNY